MKSGYLLPAVAAASLVAACGGESASNLRTVDNSQIRGTLIQNPPPRTAFFSAGDFTEKLNASAAGRDLRPAPPEATPVLRLLDGKGLADPRSEKKQADDGGALPRPERVGVKILLQVAKMVQVKTQVVGRHPQHGQPAQGIESVKTANWHGASVRRCFFATP